MKKIILTIVGFFSLFNVSISNAQNSVVEINDPNVKIFLPSHTFNNGKAIVACPGGGYSHLASNHEGYDWAPFFNNLGFTYAVINYKMPNGDGSIPMKDVEKCFKILKENAEAWKINPDSIGIMGSSAGGHLAATVATHPTEICKPAFQILFYPVISLSDGVTHKGTQKGFLGDKPSSELIEMWSAQNNVTSSTPPTFITLSSDDKAVPAKNTLQYSQALIDSNVPVELMMFPKGGHGWGYRKSGKSLPQMQLVLDALEEWLNNIDKFNKKK